MKNKNSNNNSNDNATTNAKNNGILILVVTVTVIVYPYCLNQSILRSLHASGAAMDCRARVHALGKPRGGVSSM